MYLEMLIGVLWEKNVSEVPENISVLQALYGCAVKKSVLFNPAFSKFEDRLFSPLLLEYVLTSVGH